MRKSATAPAKEPDKPTLMPTDVMRAAAGAPMKWVIPGLVGEGLTILAGRQKLGKTWMALDFALSVAIGGKALRATSCDRGDVLYVDFENGARRFCSRLETLIAGMGNVDLSRLNWALDVPPPSDERFMLTLHEHILTLQRPRLVIIDGPPRLRSFGGPGERLWGSDHAPFRKLRRWAEEYRLAVLCVCRTRKAKDPAEGGDPDAAMFAAADTTLLLDGDATGPTLTVRGRDVPARRAALRFENGTWTMLGEAVDVHRSEQRKKIIEVLEAYDRLRPHEIAEETGLPPDNVRHLLLRMVRDREIEKTGWGTYTLVWDDETDE